MVAGHLRHPRRLVFLIAGLIVSVGAITAWNANAVDAVASKTPFKAAVRPLVQAGHAHHPPGSIVGKDTPHLIPDDLAAGLFLRMIAHLADSKKPAVLIAYFDRMQKVTNMPMDADDRERLVTAARAYVKATARTKPIDGMRAGGEPSRVVAARTWSSLGETLTPDAAKGLQQYLDGHVKRHVKILKAN